jgi:hypothetical protein
VIGLKGPKAWKFMLGTYKEMRVPTNHSAVFHRALFPSVLLHIETMEFRQTTVWATVVVDPGRQERKKQMY